MKTKSLREYRPLSLRIWHWLNAFAISGLLLTVLLRKTLLSWRENSAVISKKLEAAGHTIAPELAKEIAVTIRNPLWDIHIYLGYLLGALLLGRILIILFVEKKCLLKAVLQSLKSGAIFKVNTRHYYMVKALYALFYIMTLLMVVTGFLLVFKESLSLEKSVNSFFKEIHEISMWFFVAFVGAHITGVVAAEQGEDAGLVSDMISGGPRAKD